MNFVKSKNEKDVTGFKSLFKCKGLPAITNTKQNSQQPR